MALLGVVCRTDFAQFDLHVPDTLPIVAENYNPEYYSSYRGGGFRGGRVRDIQRDMVKSLSSGVASARPVQTSGGGSSRPD